MSDQLIYASVKGDLAAQPRLGSSRISVEVTEGVVVLSGTVPDDERKKLAEAIARGVKDVKGVADLLQFP
jgi:osmotically-inducible protein OsmY